MIIVSVVNKMIKVNVDRRHFIYATLTLVCPLLFSERDEFVKRNVTARVRAAVRGWRGGAERPSRRRGALECARSRHSPAPAPRRPFSDSVTNTPRPRLLVRNAASLTSRPNIYRHLHASLDTYTIQAQVSYRFQTVYLRKCIKMGKTNSYDLGGLLQMSAVDAQTATVLSHLRK